MKKSLKVLFALIFCSLMLAACSETTTTNTDNSEAETTTTTASEEAATAADETAEEESDEISVTSVVDEMFASYDYGGYEFRILAPDSGGHFYYWVSSETNEIYYDELNGEAYNDAIVNRNLRTEAELNVKINPVWAVGDTGGITSTLKQAVTAGSDDFDLVLNRMDYLGTSMTNGNIVNLNNISTMDTSHSWWDKNIVESFTLLDNRIYFISGDINVFDDYAVEGIFFNKHLCDINNLEYPYQKVLEGTWTIDEFYKYCEAVTQDTDGDGEIVVGTDVIGHAEQNDHVKHWLYAMGEKSMSIDEEGNFTVNLLNESQINAVDRIYEYMVDKQMTYTASEQNFREDKVLFLGDMVGMLNQYRDMESEFGIIPMPKYDESQENYGNYVSNGWTTALAIPLTNPDYERTGTIFETMCGYSTDTVHVALYDVLFEGKLTRDEESVSMLDIIFSCKSYDWAVDFTWGGQFANVYNSIYNNKNNAYVSTAEKSLKAINKMLEKTINAVKELQY